MAHRIGSSEGDFSVYIKESLSSLTFLKIINIFYVEGNFEQLLKAGEGGVIYIFVSVEVSGMLLHPFPCKHVLSVGC